MQVILSHKRITILLKILSTLGVSLTLCFCYINFNPSKQESASDLGYINESYSLKTNNKPKYEMTLQSSIFEGKNKNLDPYKIKASKVIKVFEDQYNLNQINVLYTLNNKDDLMINADTGIVNEITKRLQLNNNVKFILGDIEFSTNAMEINLASKEMESHSGVALLYRNSQITSNSFSSKENNNIINFVGQVSMRLNVLDF